MAQRVSAVLARRCDDKLRKNGNCEPLRTGDELAHAADVPVKAALQGPSHVTMCRSDWMEVVQRLTCIASYLAGRYPTASAVFATDSSSSCTAGPGGNGTSNKVPDSSVQGPVFYRWAMPTSGPLIWHIVQQEGLVRASVAD